MKPILSSLLFAAALFSATAVYAVGEATPDEAKAMAIKAAEYLKVVGPDKAFPSSMPRTGRGTIAICTSTF